MAIIASIVIGAVLVKRRTEGLYMGLILVWAGPFVLLLWTLAHQLILELPFSNTLIPIALPTLYLWIVDTLALQRGTWVIEGGTKVGIQLWEGLELEEAVFFLLTNVLVVFGLIAFDNALAILETFPSLFPSLPVLPSPLLLVKALLTSTQAYDDDRIEGLQQALLRLRLKSRSFYLASGVFQGRLRIDLVILYSFCRVADDLVDDASSSNEARDWITKLVRYLDLSYSEKAASVPDYILKTFPPFARSALLLLPISYLTQKPLYDLLKGFETDLNFQSSKNPFPIRDEETLMTYGSRVAGTVAELCIELVYHHTALSTPSDQIQATTYAGGKMGIALQYINIARDISVDAANARVYIPTSWLKYHSSGPEQVLDDCTSPLVEIMRQRLLDRAMLIYDESKRAIDHLPIEARGPMRVAVESYVEIGRVLRKPGYRVKAGRATVPKLRRIRVAWKALNI